VGSDQLARDLNLSASTAPDSESGTTRAALSGEGTWWPSDDIASALKGADAVLILTEWSQYQELDLSALAPLMRQPA